MLGTRVDDAELSERAAAILRTGRVEQLDGADAVALLMVAADASDLTAGGIEGKLVKLGCHPSLRARIHKLVSIALDDGLVRFQWGRIRGNMPTLRARARKILAAGTSHGASASARNASGSARKPTRAASEPRTATVTAPAAANTTAALPDAPAFAAAHELVTLPSADALARALAAAPADLDALLCTLAAHVLAAAEQFDELLAPSTMRGVTSHRYQIETVRRVLRGFRGRALLADEVGLGKTVEAILVLREYMLRGMAGRVLVLTPPALVRHWVGELSDKAGVECLTTEDPRARRDPKTFWGEDGIVVASLHTARTARHAEHVKAQPWDLVVVDEAHHVKRRTSLGWKLVDGVRSRFLLLLTATPIENELDEIYSLVTLLRPGHFATAAAFRARFVDAKNPTSPRNRERLRALLAR